MEIILRDLGLFLLLSQGDISCPTLIMLLHTPRILLQLQCLSSQFTVRANNLPWTVRASIAFGALGKSVHVSEDLYVKPFLSSILPHVQSVWGEWWKYWGLVQKSQRHWKQRLQVFCFMIYNLMEASNRNQKIETLSFHYSTNHLIKMKKI